MLDHTTIGYTRREPYGVVVTIIPFNMPVAMFAAKASVALAGGNTVVAKAPEQASVGMLRLIRSGNVWVNTYMQIRYELPFGGFKDSGYGHDTVLDFTREKTAVLSLGPQLRADQNPIPVLTE